MGSGHALANLQESLIEYMGSPVGKVSLNYRRYSLTPFLGGHDY